MWKNKGKKNSTYILVVSQIFYIILFATISEDIGHQNIDVLVLVILVEERLHLLWKIYRIWCVH